MTPGEVTLDIGATQSFSFTALDEFGNEIPDAIGDATANWSAESELGTIDAEGLLTTGTLAGDFPAGVVVEFVEGSDKVSATANVTIRPGPLAAIDVQPASIVLEEGETQQFAAVGKDPHGNEIPDLAFIWGTTGGIINQQGDFSATAESGTHVVRATAFSGQEATGSATVRVPLHVWDFRDGLSGWSLGEAVNVQTTDEGLAFEVDEGQHAALVTDVRVGLRGQDLTIVIRFKRDTADSETTFFWSDQFAEARRLQLFPRRDGQWTNLEFPVPRQTSMDAHFRFDPINGESGGDVVIESIQVIPNPSSESLSEPAPSFSHDWGSEGDGEGQFDSPDGVAVDGDGFIYVADLRNHRIQKFTPSGDFVTSWGSRGSDQGQFRAPRDVVVGPEGNIYVADTNNARVQVFDTMGQFIREFGGARAWALAFDSAGNVYAVEQTESRVVKFSPEGQWIDAWGDFGRGGPGRNQGAGFAHGEFFWPTGIAVDTNDFVYVADRRNHRIQKFTADGEFVKEWGFLGSELGRLYNPRDIAVGADGGIYVVDETNHRIQKFTADGQLLAQWGGKGAEGGLLDTPFDIAIGPDGRVYVVDRGNTRIVAYAP